MRPEDRPLGSSGFNPRGDHLDQLDALLTARYAGASAARAGMAPADLAPLLAAADTLNPLADALPTVEFAAQLEARLLARAEAQAPTIPMTVFPPANPARPANPVRRRAAPRRRHLSQFTWAAVAACVLLGMTVGALTASAHPGAPFYPLRKAVEGISSNLTGSSAATARDDLQRASAALVAFNAAASRGDNAAALTALGQVAQADQQATDAIAQVGDSGQRATLLNQLESLHAQETTDLRSALPNLGWPARVQVTSALRALKAPTLSVTSARIISAHGSDSGGDKSGGKSGGKSSGQVTVIVNGAGFTPGAVLLINDQPAGVVDAVTARTVAAHLASGTTGEDVSSIGVGEPDGSAASTTHVESDDHNFTATTTPESGDNSTPDAESTPTQASGDGGGGGDGSPTPQQTPGAIPSPSGRDH